MVSATSNREKATVWPGAIGPTPAIVSCRQPVTVVNFPWPLSSCHKAPLACAAKAIPVSGGVSVPSSGFRLYVLALLCLLGFATSASAQFDRAAVVGTVHDSSGAVVPD